MAKTRATVNESELQLVELAKELSKLQAKRRQKADELAALGMEIESVSTELRSMVPTETDRVAATN
jgi:chromosome segregation ATPase